MRADAQRLVETYADLIAKVVYGYLGNLDDAQDICHDVLLKALMRDAPFENLEHEKAWMIRTAINTSKNYLTSAGRRLTDPLDEAEEGSYDPHELDEDLMLPTGMPLAEAIDTLTPSQREAVLLRYWAGYSVNEIARITGTSAGTISMRLARARTTIKSLATGAHHDSHLS